MLKFIYIIFILGFFLSNEGYSGGNTAFAVTPSDLTDMLRNPTERSKASESFPTRITRPYAQNPKQDMRFFSDPKSSRGTWNREYQNYTNAFSTNCKP